VRSAYLLNLKLTADLTSWEFKENSYDGCNVNETFINGKNKYQCTIQWHVHDLKISCKSNRLIKAVVQRLKEVYGKIAPLTISNGKVHEYLGMEIDFSKKGKVIYTQYDYIDEILFSVSNYKDMQGESPTPASLHLFQNDDEAAVLLPEDQADLFHHYVAQLLFLCQRARPDLQTAMAFLCTRVKAPNEHDWKKLCHVTRYLLGTAHLPLIIGWNQSGNIY